MDLRLIFNALWKRKLLMSLGIIAGVVFALLSLIKFGILDKNNNLMFSYEPRSLTSYETNINLIVDVPGFGLGRTDISIAKGAELAPTYSFLATSDSVLTRVEQVFEIEDLEITSSAIERSPVIQIFVEGNNAKLIRSVAMATAEEFVDYIKGSQVDNRVPKSKRVEVRLLGPPSDSKPLKSRKYEIAIILFLAPLFAAAGLAFVLENLARVKEAIVIEETEDNKPRYLTSFPDQSKYVSRD